MNNSYWLESAKAKSYPAVEKNESIHTLIIGAGISGLTCAYYLSSITSNVIIVEADQIGYGASGRNTGKLSSQHGLCYKELIRLHGEQAAKQYYTAQQEAIDSVEEIINKHSIDCDFKRCSSVVYTNEESTLADMQDEFQACLDLGLPAHYIEETSTPIPMKAGIRFPKQAKFHPYRYLLGLSDILDQANIQIYEHSPVSHIVKQDNGYCVLIKEHKIHCQQIIMTTQFPIYDDHHFIFTRCYGEVSSIAAFPNPDFTSEDILLEAKQAKHSYSLTASKEPYLLCGGNPHAMGKEDKKEYDDFLHHLQTDWHIDTIPYAWSSQDYLTLDKLPMIGPLQKQDTQLYFATGFQKWGNTNGTIAGKLLSAYVLKQPSQYQELFSPHRLHNLFTPKFLKLNAKTMMEFLKSKAIDIDSTYPSLGEASIIKLDHHNYGMYRDVDEQVYIVDITCPHLGCTLSFNSVDKTWDCPCHGSRFSYSGDIIKGPATISLHHYGEGLNPIDPHIFE